MINSTDAIVDFARTERALSDADALVRSLIDTVAVTLPGYDTDALEILMRWSARELAPGPAAVWGQGQTASVSRAALLNGTAAHALDFDDAVPSMPLHPSAVVWPTVLAWADANECDTAKVLRAADIGQAVFRAVGEALPMKAHYGRGWHATATVGRIAAVAALIHLADLDVPQARNALGIAATMAAGSIANFGTMTKPMHAGHAAQDAVIAVGLAQEGFTANASQLDHKLGYFALLGVADHPRENLPERLAYWYRGWIEDWTLKQYPSCYGTHRAIDAMLALREELDDPGSFERIEVTVQPTGLMPLIDHLPTTGLEGKFSLPYTMVRSLLDGRMTLDAFSDDRVNADGTTALLERVEVREASAPADRPEIDGQLYSQVVVTDANGNRIERTVTISRGDSRNPLTDAEVDAKFLACLGVAGWSTERATTLLTDLHALTDGGELQPVQATLNAKP